MDTFLHGFLCVSALERFDAWNRKVLIDIILCVVWMDASTPHPKQIAICVVVRSSFQSKVLCFLNLFLHFAIIGHSKVEMQIDAT